MEKFPKLRKFTVDLKSSWMIYVPNILILNTRIHQHFTPFFHVELNRSSREKRKGEIGVNLDSWEHLSFSFTQNKSTAVQSEAREQDECPEYIR